MTDIADLICEYRANPQGIDVTSPRLGWAMKTERHGARQAAYQVFAAADPDRLISGQSDLWDSGRVESDESLHVVYRGKPLQSRQRVYWKVTVWDEEGAVAQSDPAWFEMGLLSKDDWQAQWIGAELAGGAYSMIPAPYLRCLLYTSDAADE